MKAEIDMDAEQAAYEELSYYTLGHGEGSFIHQHVVDAFAAQSASEQDKPVRLTFALVGLFLYIEKQFSGRQVQLVHMQLARRQQPWPVFSLPKSRGALTPREVLAAPPGPERDGLIHQWCTSVWEAYREHRPAIVSLLREQKII